MSLTNGVNALEPERFRRSFPEIRGLISEEWPALDDAALSAAGGNLDEVIELVADATGHTRTLVRRQLAELSQLAESESASGDDAPSLSDAADKLKEKLSGHAKDDLDRLRVVVEGLEERTRDLVQYAQGDLLKEAETKMSKNIWTSLAMALGLGLILGLLLRGRD